MSEFKTSSLQVQLAHWIFATFFYRTDVNAHATLTKTAKAVYLLTVN